MKVLNNLVLGIIILVLLNACGETVILGTSNNPVLGSFIDVRVIQNNPSLNLIVSFRFPVEKKEGNITLQKRKGSAVSYPQEFVKISGESVSLVDTTGKHLKYLQDYKIVEGDSTALGINTYNNYEWDEATNEYRKTYGIKILKKGKYGIEHQGGRVYLKRNREDKFVEHLLRADFTTQTRNQHLLPKFNYSFRKGLSDKTPPLVEPAGPGAYYLFEIK